MKRIFAIMMIMCMLMTSSVTVFAESSLSIEDKEKMIEACVNQFFYSYENIDNKEICEVMNEIEGLSSSKNKEAVFLTTDSENENMQPDLLNAKSYLNTVSYMLERKAIIQESVDVDEQEYDKKLDVSINNIKFEQGKAYVSVEVYKTWHYSFSPDIESSSRDTYELSLSYEGNNYMIDNVSGFAKSILDQELESNGDILSYNSKSIMLENMKENLIEEQRLQKLEMISNTDDEEATVYATNNYSPSAASKYALNHATNYNKNYADFNGYGGDCTNFTSQCLKAGGIKQHTGDALVLTNWFYKTSENRSATWTHANNFRTYIRRNNSKINMPASSWSNVEIGDIIQLKNSDGTARHSLIISGVAYGSSGRSDLLVCSHTPDKGHVSLNTFGSGAKYYYRVKGNK